MRRLSILLALVLGGCTGLFSGDGRPLPERAGVVRMRNTPLTLLGPDLRVGQPAPDFKALDVAFQPFSLSAFAGKPVLISAVPSLDTGVCSLQTKRFNDEIRKLPAEARILTISMDLPFAQKRFCDAEKVDRILVLSDSAGREFGSRYGVLVKERGLLARSIFVVNRDGTLAYKEIVPDMSQHPDYITAIEALRAAIERPDPRKMEPALPPSRSPRSAPAR